MPAYTPEQCDALFSEYVNEGDLDELVGLYEETATLAQQDGTDAHGVEAIRRALGDLVAMRPKIRMNIVRTVRAADDLAILYNDWEMTMKGPDGSDLEMAGKAIEIVRRQSDGLWLFVLDDPFARG